MTPEKFLVISGGTKGLGRELSLAFAAEGFKVIALFSSDQGAADEWTQVMTGRGFSGIALRADISKPGLSDLLDKKSEIPSGSEITLIHGACPSFEPKSFHKYDETEIDSMIDVTLKGGVHLAQWTIPRMVRAKKGTVIQILSKALEEPRPKGFAPYIAAKAGLGGFTQALAVEYSGLGLRVFSVSPGFMKTSLTENWDERLKEGILSGKVPMEPHQVAQSILKLTLSTETKGRGENYII